MLETVFEKGARITCMFDDEPNSGVIEDVHRTCGVFVRFDKPVETNCGLRDSCWIEIPGAKYREIPSDMGFVPKKQLIRRGI